MNTSLDIVARLNDILPNPGCVYNALESILGSCHTPERLEERTWLGIQLSICEFQAASVNFPAVCADQGSLSACTQLLETKATWWTTFSGNYRHISAICLEYQPHFESQKVISTFKDASRLFADYQTEVDQVLKNYEHARSSSLHEWQRQAKDLSGTLADVLLGLNSLGRTLENTSQAANAILTPLASALDLAEMQLEQAVTSSQLLVNQAEQVSARVATFDCAMADVESRHIQTAEKLQTTVDSTMSSLDVEIKSLQSVLGGVKTVLGVLGVFMGFFRPILILALVAGLLYFLVRLWQSNKPLMLEKTIIDESDLVFY